MMALKILKVKQFMVRLFLQETFDKFLVSESDVRTAYGFKITGRLNKD